jgi:hypothetical protein
MCYSWRKFSGTKEVKRAEQEAQEAKVKVLVSVCCPSPSPPAIPITLNPESQRRTKIQI